MSTETKEVDVKIEQISSDIQVMEMEVGKVSVIKNDEQYQLAVNQVAKLVARRKRSKEARDEIVKPLKDHANMLDRRFNEASAPYEDMEARLKRAMGDYSLEQARKVREKEEIARKKQEEKNAKAIETGKPIDVAPVVIEQKPQTVLSDTGSKATTKKVWKHEITDVQALPLKFRKLILEKALERGVADTIIRSAVIAGEREIAGVRVYEDIEISVR